MAGVECAGIWPSGSEPGQVGEA